MSKHKRPQEMTIPLKEVSTLVPKESPWEGYICFSRRGETRVWKLGEEPFTPEACTKYGWQRMIKVREVTE